MLARGLVAALEAPGRAPEGDLGLTHGFHTYPARMHPTTARALLGVVAGPDRVLLDPFCGSGTVLVEARRQGARAIGVDLNPLAIAIARAKVWAAPGARRNELARVADEIAGAALAAGKAARRATVETSPLRGPGGERGRSRDRRIGEWFAPHVRREIEFIAGAIDEVRRGDAELAGMLDIALSSILYKVSRRASDTDPTRVDRKVARGAAARLLRERIPLLDRGLAELDRTARHPVTLYQGDARALTELGIAPGSVHAVVTSPPYAGTYDYADQHQLRLDFFNMPSAALRTGEIGARRSFTGTDATGKRPDRAAAVRQWERDLGDALSAISKALAPGGRAAIMLGDSIAGAGIVLADQIMTVALPDGLEMVAWAWQERPKLGAERRAFVDRPKREHIFLLQRAPFDELRVHGSI
ncbi:MAG TPA: DNA methyltransferase [Kofleriaceae bacterium]|nr:DNA methyltransferase [Kofleriaceae bacterium]